MLQFKIIFIDKHLLLTFVTGIFLWQLFWTTSLSGFESDLFNACMFTCNIKLKLFEKGNTRISCRLPDRLFYLTFQQSTNDLSDVMKAGFPCKFSNKTFYSCAEVSSIEKIVCFMHITYTGCSKKNICTIIAAFPSQGCLEHTSFMLIYRYISSR